MMFNLVSSDAEELWKQRFRVATMTGCQIASDNPGRGIICSNLGGLFQIHAWDVLTGKLQQVTHDVHGNVMGAISPDGQFIYTVLDPDGDQYGHFARLSFDGGSLQDLTPGFPQYSLSQICLSASGNRLAFAVPRPGDEGTDLYVVSLGEQIGQPEHVFHDPIPGLHGRKRLALSADGGILVFASSERNPTMFERLLAFDTRTAERLNVLSDGPENSVSLGNFSPIIGDTRVIATVYHGDARQALLWNPHTHEQLQLDWELDGYVTPVVWPDASHLLLYQQHEAGSRHVLYSLRDRSIRTMQYVAGLHGSATFGKESTLYIEVANRRPSEIAAMDMTGGAVKEIVLSGGPIPPERPWTSVTFPSSDGQPVQAWLLTPEGNGPFPTILAIHGGPHQCEWERYAPEYQLWLDHGYAVFIVNYRGSTSFGRPFEQKILGNPGYWELEDIVAGRNWLVEHNIALPGAILITGWSYGGFLTLLALGKFPHLWAAGMAGYAIADWTTHYEEAAAGVKMPGLFGGTPQEKPEQYDISSPITYAQQVQAPILIYQGRNDPGCPPGQIERYVDLLRALDKSVELVWIDAGHGTLDTEQEIVIHELLLRFAEGLPDIRKSKETSC